MQDFPASCHCLLPTEYAQVVELVDTQDLKSCGREAVRVQVPPRVPQSRKAMKMIHGLFALHGLSLWGTEANEVRVLLQCSQFPCRPFASRS